jgi:ribose/xylose/arabinose/galactoside ABC-type transport system permease subunit
MDVEIIGRTTGPSGLMARSSRIEERDAVEAIVGMSAPTPLPSRRTILLIALLVLTLGALFEFAPHFFTVRNVTNVLVQSSTLAMLAIGMSFVMIGGGIDLSTPANMALSAVMGALALQAGGPFVLCALVMIVTGAAIGAFNGFAVGYMRMIPFVVTLATMTIVTGLTIWVTGEISVPVVSDSYLGVFGASWARVSISVPALAIVAILATIVMSSTIYGRSLYALGINAEVALVARVPIRRVAFISYLLAGALAGLTAVFLAARLGSASAAMGGDGVVLDVISACVVGGVSIYGGVGRPLGAVVGAVLIALIANAMNMLGVSYYFSLMAKGVVIVAFIFVDGQGKAT